MIDTTGLIVGLSGIVFGIVGLARQLYLRRRMKRIQAMTDRLLGRNRGEPSTIYVALHTSSGDGMPSRHDPIYKAGA